MNEFFIILNQIVKFMVMILVGIICVKTKVLKEEGLGVISSLVVKVTLPIFIFCNTIFGATREQLISDFVLIPLFIFIYIVLVIIAKVLSKLAHMKAEKKNIYESLFIFGNVGFIGIPLIAAVMPEHGMLYIALFTIVDQAALWTLGVHLTSPIGEGLSLSNLKKMLNPPLVAIFSAIVIVMCGLKLPVQLTEPLKAIGNVTTPLCLIYIGGSLCFCDFSKIIKCKEIYVGIVVKMLVLPIIIFKLLALAGISTEEVRLTIALLVALPTMLTIPMLAKSNGVEGEYCVSGAMLTQIFSLATLPIVSYIVLVL